MANPETITNPNPDLAEISNPVTNMGTATAVSDSGSQSGSNTVSQSDSEPD
jgi:hypothetical protein